MDIINPLIFHPSMLTSCSVAENEYLNWGAASYVVGTRVILPATHRVYECSVAHTTVGTIAPAAVTISVAAPAVVTWVAHGLTAGAEVIFTTNGDLPAGITAGTKYYAQSIAPDTFTLSRALSGLPVTTTAVGSGTYTATTVNTTPDVSIEGLYAKWLDLGATNKFAMFDEKFGTQTKAAGSISLTLTPGRSIDSLALLNLIGHTVHVVETVGGVTKYDETFSLQSSVGVYSWSTYFMAPIVAEKDLVITNLLPYYNQVITITITGAADVAIGNVATGVFVPLGKLEYSPKIGIVDYSRVDTAADGSTFITRRPYSKKFGGNILVPDNFVDQLAGILASIRSTPVIWIGAHYSSLVVWGMYKDFEIDIKYPTYSYCSINILGLA